jgi:hypothetical protein
MPLSESEQKILSDLEVSFVRSARRASLFFDARRRMRWSVAGFIIGLTLLVVFLTHSILLSLLGVLVMLVSCLVFARTLELKGQSLTTDQHR